MFLSVRNIAGEHSNVRWVNLKRRPFIEESSRPLKNAVKDCVARVLRLMSVFLFIVTIGACACHNWCMCLQQQKIKNTEDKKYVLKKEYWNFKNIEMLYHQGYGFSTQIAHLRWASLKWAHFVHSRSKWANEMRNFDVLRSKNRGIVQALSAALCALRAKHVKVLLFFGL